MPSQVVVAELAKKYFYSRKGIPVILVSGHPDAEKIVLEHEPVVASISKPATLKSLQRAIEQAVASLRDMPRRPK